MNGIEELKLRTRAVGARFHYLESVGSTNAVLLELAASGEPAGTVVLAEEQTEGRGRAGRAWYSPAGRGIWMSVLVRTDMPPDRLAPLSVAAALAVASVLRANAGLDVRVKWPNDLLVGGRKLGGVLVESVQTQGEPATAGGPATAAAVGLGLNANLAERDLPPELSGRATSLEMAYGRPMSRVEVIGWVLTALENCFEKFERQGIGGFRDQWRQFSELIGRRVRVTQGAASEEGTVIDLAPTGALEVMLESGEVVEIWHGDVTPEPLEERGTDDD